MIAKKDAVLGTASFLALSTRNNIPSPLAGAVKIYAQNYLQAPAE